MTESKMENVIRLRSKEFRRDKGVKWSRINKYLPFKWIPKGYEVNSNSCAYDIFHSFIQNSSFNQTIAAKQTSIANEPNEVLADSWFWNGNNYKKIEAQRSKGLLRRIPLCGTIFFFEYIYSFILIYLYYP